MKGGVLNFFIGCLDKHRHLSMWNGWRRASHASNCSAVPGCFNLQDLAVQRPRDGVDRTCLKTGLKWRHLEVEVSSACEW